MSAGPPHRIIQGDTGLVWQLGLAIAGGLILIGIPCSFLLSYWAQRRLEAIRNLDTEAGETPPASETRRRVIKDTDLELFPVKPYHPNSLGRQSARTLPDTDDGTNRSVRSIVVLASDHQNDEESDPTEDDTCPICIENFKENEFVRELVPCGHYFHPPCIEPWLTEQNGVCPLCRSCLWAQTSEIDLTDVRHERAASAETFRDLSLLEMR